MVERGAVARHDGVAARSVSSGGFGCTALKGLCGPATGKGREAIWRRCPTPSSRPEQRASGTWTRQLRHPGRYCPVVPIDPGPRRLCRQLAVGAGPTSKQARLTTASQRGTILAQPIAASSPAALHGVVEKLRRAKAHSADLVHRLDSVLGPDKQRFLFDPDGQAGEHALSVFRLPAIEPEWQLIIGDCLFNLRSALDHLAWQLVLLDGKQPVEKTQFPVRESPFNKNGVRLPRPNLTPEVDSLKILDALEAVQPYVAPHIAGDAKTSPLWMLHRLNNIDKHRLLLVLVSVTNIREMWWGWDDVWGRAPHVKINSSALKDGSPIAWFNFHGAGPPEDFNPHPAVQITIDESDTPRLRNVRIADVLNTFISWVEYDILDQHFRGLFP